MKLHRIIKNKRRSMLSQNSILLQIMQGHMLRESSSQCFIRCILIKSRVLLTVPTCPFIENLHTRTHVSYQWRSRSSGDSVDEQCWRQYVVDVIISFSVVVLIVLIIFFQESYTKMKQDYVNSKSGKLASTSFLDLCKKHTFIDLINKLVIWNYYS